MTGKLKNYIRYYFWATYRRKLLDRLLEENKHYYKGIVLDIGGRDRGRFKKPKDKVEKWIFADVETRYKPDIVLDVANMDNIGSESIDTINAIELFEHVENLEKGLEECYRILKRNGIMILSVPFLYPIHADPYDFQRWTKDKWKMELKKIGYKIEKIVIMGRYFTVLADMEKILINKLPVVIRHLCKLFYPLIDVFVKIDNTGLIKNNQGLNKFHGGYFIILKKVI